MGYIVGVSSGMYMMAQQDEKGQYITIPKKIFRGGMEGVNFTQVDIETITEFNEPYLEKETEKIKNLGIEFGVHGESYAMGGGEKPMGMLDSAIETNYIHSHDRLIKHIDGCGLIGAKYVNIHPSETMPFLKLNMSFQPTTLVDPWGRSFKEFFKENFLEELLKNGRLFLQDKYIMIINENIKTRVYQRENLKGKLKKN